MLLLLPHAAGRIVATNIRKHSVHTLRRFLSKPVAKTQPSSPSGSNDAKNLPLAFSKLSVGASAASAAALIVSVAFAPGVTDAGEMPHVGIGAGPATEHASAIVPVNPPC